MLEEPPLKPCPFCLRPLSREVSTREHVIPASWYRATEQGRRRTLRNCQPCNVRSSPAEGRLLRLGRESAGGKEEAPRSLHRALKLSLRRDLSLLLASLEGGRVLPAADVDLVFTKIARGALAIERRQLPPAAERLHSRQIASEALESLSERWPETPPILWLECSASLLALWPDSQSGILALHFAFQSALMATEWRATSAESLSPPG